MEGRFGGEKGGVEGVGGGGALGKILDGGEEGEERCLWEERLPVGCGCGEEAGGAAGDCDDGPGEERTRR